MTDWYTERSSTRSAKAVIAVSLLALLPVALLAGVVVMVLGHVVGGLALFGGSILAAGAGVALAGITGTRHLHKLLSRSGSGSGSGFRVVQLDHSQYTEVS